jgi:SHS2 domain-containing protein
VAEAVRALVDSFADTAHGPVTAVHVLDLGDDSDEGVLLGALDEVVYLLDADGVVPVTVETERARGGVRLVLGVTDLAQVDITGPAPKGVARSDLGFDRTPSGWSCEFTVDV